MNTAIRNDQPDDIVQESAASPESARWSSMEMLLAALVDDVRLIGWSYAQAHSKNTVQKPKPLARPGVSGRQKISAMRLQDMKNLDPRLRGLTDEEAIAKLRELTGRG